MRIPPPSADMHFALPPRRTSRPPPYVASRPVASPWRRRRRLKVVSWSIAGVLFLIILLSQFKSGRSQGDNHPQVPPNTPSTVLVTVIDPTLRQSYIDLLNENRSKYAAKHGYKIFIAHASDYDLRYPSTTKNDTIEHAPPAWAKVPALRHAMARYPHSKYFFFLDHHTFIVHPELTVDQYIMDDAKLERIMIPNQPVVPKSVIKTPSSRNPSNIDLVLTQDAEGLRQESFIIRQGEWAKFFLDSWFDPLYRSYNFQRAEGHALEHLVQWHPTILARLAIVPQRIINSYYVGTPEQLYHDGDFIANLIHCEKSPDRSCEEEAKIVIAQFNARFSNPGQV